MKNQTEFRCTCCQELFNRGVMRPWVKPKGDGSSGTDVKICLSCAKQMKHLKVPGVKRLIRERWARV